MNYVRQTPTEECPLTKEKKNCSVSDCCGFRSIICSFIGLTAIITAALFLQLSYDENTFQGRLNVHAAVATDHLNCSQIGTKIIRKGGNAVDAAIAATLCMAVVAPHKTGLGSGGYIMVYNHINKGKPIVIDFLSNRTPDDFKKLGVSIPTLLQGLEYAHTIYGKLPWQDLILPSAILAETGFEVSRDFAYEATKNPDFGSFKHINAGEILKLPDLAFTLNIASKQGINVLYKGDLANKLLINTTETNDKLISQIEKYTPKISQAQMSTLSQYAIFYPSNLKILQSIIDVMNNLNISKENASLLESEILVAENIIKLTRQLKDPYINYVETRRYTSVSVVDSEDFYVSIITGLSAPLNLDRKNGLGFALDSADNENSLFSLTPVIFYDQKAICGLRGVFSTDDSIVTAQILNNLLLRSMDISAAVEYPRYYLLSDGIAMENDDKELGNKLLHDSLIAIDSTSKTDANTITKSVNVIIKKKNLISAHSDSRGHGLASRF